MWSYHIFQIIKIKIKHLVLVVISLHPLSVEIVSKMTFKRQIIFLFIIHNCRNLDREVSYKLTMVYILIC